MTAAKKARTEIKLPSAHDWRTSDTDEINKRRVHAREESFDIANTDGQHPIFSNFRVQSRSGLTYAVEVRDLRQRQCACDCVDFRINGLGTCKHVEAVLLHLEARFRNLFKSAAKDTLRVLDARGELPRTRRRAEQQRREQAATFAESDEHFAYIAGHTEGGAPFGVTWEEWKESDAQSPSSTAPSTS